MKIAIITTDNRENFRNYDLKEPYFGTAPTALMEGFAMLSKDLEVHVISCTQQAMPSPEKLAHNIRFHSLHVPNWGWLRSGYLGCVLAVGRKFREIKPDLIHAQGTERDCAISAVLAPYPRLLTIHGNLRLIKKQVGFRPFSAMWLQSFLEGFVVPRFHGVVCITNYTKAAVEHEVSRNWVIPNAVDSSFFEIGRKRVLQRSDSSASRLSTFDGLPPPPIILVVGTIEERKNQNFLIKALDSLAENYPFEVRFFGKCGEDPYGAVFRALVAERKWCHFGGMLGREELKEEFVQASMLVLPTHEDNCPMVVLEAQASGVPVIASNVGGIPDLIEGGVTGLLIDPHDVDSIRRAVALLLTDATVGSSLADQGLEHALSSYHPEVIARKHLEIYNQILSGKQGSR